MHKHNKNIGPVQVTYWMIKAFSRITHLSVKPTVAASAGLQLFSMHPRTHKQTHTYTHTDTYTFISTVTDVSVFQLRRERITCLNAALYNWLN